MVKTCIPDKLPLKKLNWKAVSGLLKKAHLVLAHSTKPVCCFSTEALQGMHSEKLDRKKKICAYRGAFKMAKNSPSITLALLQKMQAALKPGSAGKLRDKQNWIGFEGCKIEEAYFYPPRPAIVRTEMRKLLKYLRGPEKDPLVQIAIFFGQLLIIHPFMDGNGRLGRLLLPVLFHQKKLTRAPNFYMSSYFQKHRVKYFDALYEISHSGDWEGWIRFFLKGIIKQRR